MNLPSADDGRTTTRKRRPAMEEARKDDALFEALNKAKKGKNAAASF